MFIGVGKRVKMANNTNDLKDMEFGRLWVKKYSHSDKDGAHWVCVCECLNEITIKGSLLTSGKTKSCGCLRRENFKKK